MDKYKNLEKTLKKYGQKAVYELQSIVGVDTGALSASIDYKIEDEDIIIEMLDYGQYINPWIKKGDGGNYMQVIRKLEPQMLKELGKSYALDLVASIKKNIKK